MITNRDLQKFGLDLEKQKVIDRRVQIMSRIVEIREKIKWCNDMIVTLEKDLHTENVRIRDTYQHKLDV